MLVAKDIDMVLVQLGSLEAQCWDGVENSIRRAANLYQSEDVDTVAQLPWFDS